MRYVVAVLVVALATVTVLFPPADRVVDGTPVTWIGPNSYGGTPKSLHDVGFTFIDNIGGPIVIRYQQWVIELSVVLAVAIFAVILFHPRKT